jgi:hypothetical protein
MPFESLANSVPRRRMMAVALFALLMGAMLLSNAVSVLERPVAAGKAGGWGPADLGRIRGQLAGLQLNQNEFDEGSARRALATAPLASEPFAAIAAASLIENPRGNTGGESALLAEALRRDPRSRPARILLMRQMAVSGDMEGAFAQLDVLYRLNPVLVTRAMESIAGLVNTPKRMDAALAALAGRSNLYQPFVVGMVGKNKPREIVVRLAQGLPANILAKPEIRNSVVAQLVEVQEFALARSIWQAGLAKQPSGLVFAPDFADRQTPPPFNWRLFETTSGAADFVKPQGLAVNYYDRSPGRLVSQIVTLPPGRYRLYAEFKLVGGSADNVRLRIGCFGGPEALAEIPLFASGPGLRKAEAGFEVPAQACSGQELAVWGIVTEKRSEAEVELQRVDILPGGSSR